jgi:hypothetical protein
MQHSNVQWSGGNGYGFKARNGISFGPDLLAKCHTFSPVMSRNWHWHWPDTNGSPGASSTPQHHLSPIWRIFKGLKSMDMVLRPHKWDQFCPDSLAKCHTFSPVMSRNWHWHWPDTNGSPGASSTPQHHLSDPYGGYSMVWRQWIWF